MIEGKRVAEISLPAATLVLSDVARPEESTAQRASRDTNRAEANRVRSLVLTRPLTTRALSLRLLLHPLRSGPAPSRRGLSGNPGSGGSQRPLGSGPLRQGPKRGRGDRAPAWCTTRL